MVCKPEPGGEGGGSAPTPASPPRDKRSPVLHGSSRVLAAAHAHHDHGEEEEEGSHGEAHAVHGFVAQEAAAVDVGLDPQDRPAAFTETGELQRRREGEHHPGIPHPPRALLPPKMGQPRTAPMPPVKQAVGLLGDSSGMTQLKHPAG